MYSLKRAKLESKSAADFLEQDCDKTSAINKQNTLQFFMVKKENYWLELIF
jgi:hypothetical protein